MTPFFVTSKSRQTLQGVLEHQYQSKGIIKRGGEIFENHVKIEGVKRGYFDSK